ncbi:MAG: hypothetical protein II680_05790 [Clostridia bacterium]|nr:hypothetical protein [Clostridia bacterium]
MNRTLLKIALAAVLLLSLLIFPACEKDQEPDTPTEAQTFPISAAFAEEDLPDHLELVADEGENAAKILLTAETPVESFHFFALIYEEMDGDEPRFSTDELYELDTFGPEKPLLVSMTFGEVFPAYGFTFKNADGMFKTYGINLSGEDGSVIISEVRAALG